MVTSHNCSGGPDSGEGGDVLPQTAPERRSEFSEHLDVTGRRSEIQAYTEEEFTHLNNGPTCLSSCAPEFLCFCFFPLLTLWSPSLYFLAAL